MFTRTHFYCIFCVLFVVSIAFFFPSRSLVDINVDNKIAEKFSPSATYEGESVILMFHSRGYSEHIEIRFVIHEFKPTVVIANAPHPYSCNLKDDGASDCVINFVFKEDATLVHISSGDPNKKILITNVAALKEKALTPINGKIFNEVLLLLIITLPIFWLTFSKKILNQWLLISVAVFVLVKIQLAFTVVLLVFLYSSYIMGVSSKAYLRRIQKPVLFLLWSCLFLLFFKLFIVHSSFFEGPFSGLTLFVPLGISYFVIRLIDSQLKWYRGELKDVSFREFLLFIIFPPTLAAGPIDTLDRFIAGRAKQITSNDVFIGVSRIVFGLFQKLVIADFFLSSYLGNNYFSVPLAVVRGDDSGAFQLLFMSFLFVYMDFSAYSNIAIGLSALFGHRICENFNWPIFSISPREFWKRWHMSLSGWCMRNIYFPLLIQTKSFVLPSFMVMFVVGMWHSISLSWLCWAVHHTCGILVTSFVENKIKTSKIKLGKYMFLFRLPMIGATLIFVGAGYAFAQYSDVSVAIDLYCAYWRSLGHFL